jgi:hypothetical protein
MHIGANDGSFDDTVRPDEDMVAEFERVVGIGASIDL